MDEKQTEEIIEEWLTLINHEYRSIRDLELSEGIPYVNKLKSLIVIAEENLTKHNNDFKKVCPNCNDIGKVFIGNSCVVEICSYCNGKPIPKS